ncbi:MAG: DUF3592 domain-containing protein [Patescibacteria group bacterium]|jgi:hypothetical protein
MWKMKTLSRPVELLLGLLLLTFGAIFAIAAWMSYQRFESIKASFPRQEATVIDVRTFQTQNSNGRYQMFRSTTRVTFEYNDANGMKNVGFADTPYIRLTSKDGGVSVGDRIPVYRNGRSTEYAVDRWPWNYRRYMIDGAYLLVIFLVPILYIVFKRRESRTDSNAQ